MVGFVSLPGLDEMSRAARPLEERARPADAGAPLEWEMRKGNKRSHALAQAAHTTVAARGKTAHTRTLGLIPRLNKGDVFACFVLFCFCCLFCFFISGGGSRDYTSSEDPDDQERCAHSSTGFLRISRTARALHGSAARIPPAPETPLVAAPDRSLQPEIVAALENTQ